MGMTETSQTLCPNDDEEMMIISKDSRTYYICLRCLYQEEVEAE